MRACFKHTKQTRCPASNPTGKMINKRSEAFAVGFWYQWVFRTGKYRIEMNDVTDLTAYRHGRNAGIRYVNNPLVKVDMDKVNAKGKSFADGFRYVVNHKEEFVEDNDDGDLLS